MIIADTSALVSLLIDTDQNHAKAVSIAAKITDNVLIPEDVFSELINILGKKFDHKRTASAAKYIVDSSSFVIESTNEQIRASALSLYAGQAESVSYIDCIVMVQAQQNNTRTIFGFDKTFAQNGYTLP